jgi:small multidrug resistance pump
MGYILLAIAILAEVIATSALKASEEFTKLGPSMIAIIGYVLAFYFLALVLKTIPIGIAYAIWSGVGIAAIAVVGSVVFHQHLDAAAITGMGFIIVGVAVINIFSRTVVH